MNRLNLTPAQAVQLFNLLTDDEKIEAIGRFEYNNPNKVQKLLGKENSK